MTLTCTHFLMGTSGLMGTELDTGVTVTVRTESEGWGLDQVAKRRLNKQRDWASACSIHIKSWQ